MDFLKSVGANSWVWFGIWGLLSFAVYFLGVFDGRGKRSKEQEDAETNAEQGWKTVQTILREIFIAAVNQNQNEDIKKELSVECLSTFQGPAVAVTIKGSSFIVLQVVFESRTGRVLEYRSSFEGVGLDRGHYRVVGNVISRETLKRYHKYISEYPNGVTPMTGACHIAASIKVEGRPVISVPIVAE